MSKELKDIILPDLGEGIDGAEVSEISVSIGDTVKEGDTIVVLESDKASMEIPSDFDGEIKEILITTGDEVHIGQILVKIESVLGSKRIPSEETETVKDSSEKPVEEKIKPAPTSTPPHPIRINFKQQDICFTWSTKISTRIRNKSFSYSWYR